MSEDSRRRSLLDSVKAELESIPKYKERRDGDSRPEAAITAGANMFQAVRRGIRAIGGGEKSSSLMAKKKRLESILAGEKRIKNMAFFTDNGLVDYKGNRIKGDAGQFREMTSMSVSAVLSELHKANPRKKKKTLLNLKGK